MDRVGETASPEGTDTVHRQIHIPGRTVPPSGTAAGSVPYTAHAWRRFPGCVVEHGVKQ